jgi:hypothetical protein
LPNRVLLNHGPTSESRLVKCGPTSANRAVIQRVWPEVGTRSSDPDRKGIRERVEVRFGVAA